MAAIIYATSTNLPTPADFIERIHSASVRPSEVTEYTICRTCGYEEEVATLRKYGCGLPCV